MKNQSILLSGATLAFLAVALGAFGAHAWQETLSLHKTEKIFATASDYHFIHALALLWLGLFLKNNEQHQTSKTLSIFAGLSLMFGTLIFSGSLYFLALSGIRWLGAITPIGGILLLVGWACCIVLIYKTTKR